MLYELKAPHPQVKRYAKEEFPPYRFIPGLNPHPVRDEEGHSYGHEHEPLVYSPPHEWRENPSYLMGVDLYNSAFWWESHEKWEDLWHTTNKQGEHGQFLQGLIQISASFIKWYLKQREGFVRLYDLGMGRLQSVEQKHPQFMGLDLSIHLPTLEAHFKKQLSDESNWYNPLDDYPLIVLDQNP